MSKYTELKNQEAPCIDCFFAFSESQFNEGAAKIKGKKIYSASNVFSGLYGTSEGIENFLNFYVELEKRISAECDPQEVYDYEFGNHECGYVGNDEEAIKLVISYFGAERAKTVKRMCAWVNIDEVDTKNLFA